MVHDKALVVGQLDGDAARDRTTAACICIRQGLLSEGTCQAH